MIRELMDVLEDGARQNKYRVIIPGDGISSKDIDILVQSATLPGITITPVEVFIRGRKAQLRGETNLENTWDVTFYNTTNMEVRNMILEWMSTIHWNQWEPGDGGFLGQIDSLITSVQNVISNPLSLLSKGMTTYQKDIFIEQLDNDESSTYKIGLVGAFPINVSAIDLEDETSDVSKTTVTFAFTDITIDDKAGFGRSDLRGLLKNI
jgi:hypothetical protein